MHVSENKNNWRPEDLMNLLVNENKGLWEWKRDESNFRLDEYCVRILGLKNTLSSIHLRQWIGILNSSGKEAFRKTLKACNQPDTNDFHLEQQIKTENRIWRWVSLRGRVTERNAGGKVTRIVGTLEDITEQKLNDLFLQDKETRYHHLFENSGTANIFCNTRGKILLINSFAASILNSERDDLLGKNIYECLPQSLNLTLRKEIKHTIGSRREYSFIHQMQTDGKNHWYSSILYPVSDDIGNLLGIQISSRDITELKTSEESSRTHAELFRTTFEQAAVGLAQVSPSGQFLRVNKKFCDITGYSPEELTLKNYEDITHPDDLWQDEKIRKKIDSGKASVFSITKRYLHKSGRTIWIELHIQIIRNDKGIEKYSISAINDISEKRLAELKIYESEQKYRLLFERMQDPYALGELFFGENAEPSGFRFLEVNSAFITLCNLNRDQITTVLPEDIFGKVVRDWVRTCEEVVDKGSPIQFESYAEKLSSWLIISIYPYKDKQFALLIRDVTLQRRIEDEIGWQKQLIENTFDAIDDGIIITDEDNTVRICNSGVESTFGYKPEELSGRSLDMIFAEPEHSEKIYDTYFRKYGKALKANFRAYYIRKDGTVFLGETNGQRLFSSKGKYLGNYVITRDITEREKLIEELLIAKQHAEESDRLKSAFLANMSHEIRTPLNGIIGFTSLLSQKIQDDETRSQYTEIIQESSAQLVSIVNDIIDISKIETGQLEIHPGPVDVNELMNELEKFFQPQAQKKDLILGIESFCPVEQSFGELDGLRLKQILSNLINNALKFTHEGTILIGCNMEHGSYRFYVRDTGIGISEDHQQKVFDRFFRVEGTSDKIYGGTGLGLAISKALVEQMHGSISVQSIPGKGTDFRITLPYRPAIVKREIQHTEEVVFEDERQILIVEDTDINFLYLSELLEEKKMICTQAKSGEEAIMLCKDHPPDLILMDIKLPGMDGYETTRALKKFHPDIPIIAQTAFAMPGDKQKAIDAGCADYLSKPINEKHLLEKISKHLQMKAKAYTGRNEDFR